MPTLTDRQKQIMVLICQQKTNKEIAKELGLCKRNIETHKANIIFELELKNTVGIAIYAIKNGIYTP